MCCIVQARKMSSSKIMELLFNDAGPSLIFVHWTRTKNLKGERVVSGSIFYWPAAIGPQDLDFPQSLRHGTPSSLGTAVWQFSTNRASFSVTTLQLFPLAVILTVQVRELVYLQLLAYFASNLILLCRERYPTFSEYVHPDLLCSHFEPRAKPQLLVLQKLQKLQGTLVIDALTPSAVSFKPKR